MRSLSVAHWIFHALCCIAVGLISHNAYESKSLNPPRKNMLVCAVSTVADSDMVHGVTDWTLEVMNSLVHRLEPYHRPSSGAARRARAPVARGRVARRHLTH